MLQTEEIEKLRGFIKLCEANPAVLNSAELSFFRDYLLKLGAKIPDQSCPPFKDNQTSECHSKCGERSEQRDSAEFASADDTMSSDAEQQQQEVEAEEAEEEVVESDLELDMDGVLADEEEFDESKHVMGRKLEAEADGVEEISEADMDRSMELRGEAQAAFVDGDLDKAIELYTQAILLNPGSALFYAKRASIYIKLKRLRAAICDCNRALEINPDLSIGFKFRGRAYRLLGKWEQAALDLRTACRLDFDEQTDEWLREVIPNATKIQEHRRKYERLQEEREVKQKRERIRRAREENERARKRAEANNKTNGASKTSSNGGAGFGMPAGAGFGMPGGTGGVPPGMANLFKDPEIMSAMQDPEVMAAFSDVSSNPMNMHKYQDNPKIMDIMKKLTSKFGGCTAPSGGGFPGSAGGFPGGFGAGTTGNNPPPAADLDVD